MLIIYIFPSTAIKRGNKADISSHILNSAAIAQTNTRIWWDLCILSCSISGYCCSSSSMQLSIGTLRGSSPLHFKLKGVYSRIISEIFIASTKKQEKGVNLDFMIFMLLNYFQDWFLDSKMKDGNSYFYVSFVSSVFSGLMFWGKGSIEKSIKRM